MNPTVVSLRTSSLRGPLARWGWLVLALILAGYGWYRAVRFDGPTGPHLVAWRGPDDQPLVTDGDDVGDWQLSNAMMLGERLIVLHRDGEGGPNGFAWISPRLGQAKLAWPLPPQLFGSTLFGLAARDAETFAFVEQVVSKDGGETYVGIAGPSGWTVVPWPVSSWERRGEAQSGNPIVLGMAWRGDALELVLTHPRSDDAFGTWSAPDVIRVPLDGAPVVTARPMPCRSCVLHAALATERGWRLVATSMRGEAVMLFDEQNALVTPLPPEMAWWSQPSREDTDMVRLGSLWQGVGRGYLVKEDGTRMATPSPIAGFAPMLDYGRFELVDGRLHGRPRYRRQSPPGETSLRLVGGRGSDAEDARLIATLASASEDTALIGDSPEAMRAAVKGHSAYRFDFGAFLRRPGGYYAVTGDGQYITLDEELRRVDPLSLAQHLRTRGSDDARLDEPWRVAALGWVLFGLPLCLGGGALACWLERRRGRAVAEASSNSSSAIAPARARRTWGWCDLVDDARLPSLLYAVTAALALYKVLPLL